jgi:hypothetical protein
MSRTKKRRSSSKPPYEESCSRPNWMEKSRLITRRNRATVNRILGAFGVRWSHVAMYSEKTRQRPLFFDQIVKSTKIIFVSRLTEDTNGGERGGSDIHLILGT